jgi:hypothetical protein
LLLCGQALDYKSVANLPICVSQILYLTILISEIKQDKSIESRLHWANILPTTLAAATGREPMTIPWGDKYVQKFLQV